MPGMTDEEYDALDEELTRSIPWLGPAGSDWLTRRELRLMGLTKLSTDYLLTKAAATSQTPAQIIDALVRKEIGSLLIGVNICQ